MLREKKHVQFIYQKTKFLLPIGIKKYWCKVGNILHCCIIFISLKIKQSEIEQVIFCVKPIFLFFFLSFFFLLFFVKKNITLSLFLRSQVNMFDVLRRSHYLFTKKKHLTLSHFMSVLLSKISKNIRKPKGVWKGNINLNVYRLFAKKSNICLSKGNNRNTRKRCEICSKLTIKTAERRQTSFLCFYC